MNLKIDERILNPQKKDNSKRLKSWKHDPNKKISKTSVGNFKKLPKDLQEEIKTALSVFEINDEHLQIKGFKQKNCKEVCLKLGYKFESEIYPQFKSKIIRDLKKDYLYRSLRFYSTGWNNYPASIRF